jgi:hypothetical protein
MLALGLFTTLIKLIRKPNLPLERVSPLMRGHSKKAVTPTPIHKLQIPSYVIDAGRNKRFRALKKDCEISRLSSRQVIRNQPHRFLTIHNVLSKYEGWKVVL